jgi:y4mF family transcriptional regulator
MPIMPILDKSKSKMSFYCDFGFAFKDLLLIFAPKSQYIEIMTQQEIGNAIKERRKKLGVNQQTLADLASVAVNTVVAIERGEGNPQLATLLTVLDTLGLQIDINIKQLDYEKV